MVVLISIFTLFANISFSIVNTIEANSTNIKGIRVVDGALDLERASKVKTEEEDRISLKNNKPSWVFFKVKNDSNPYGVYINDNFSELSSNVKQIFIIDSSGQVEEIALSRRVFIPIARGEEVTVALKLSSNSGDYESFLKLEPYLAEFRGYFQNIFNIYNVALIYLMIIVFGILFLFVSNKAISLLFLYATFSMIELSIKLLLIHLIPSPLRVSLSIYFSILSYFILIFLLPYIFDRKILDSKRRVIDLIFYILLIFLFISFGINFQIFIIHRAYYLVRIFISLVIAMISIESFYSYNKKRFLFLFITTIFISLIIALKLLYLVGLISLHIFSWVYITKATYLIPNLVIICMLYSNIKKRLVINNSKSYSSSLFFKSIKEAKSLRESLTKFISYSNKNIDYDTVKVFLSSKEGFHFYTTIPIGGSSNSAYAKKIIELIPKDEIFISGNINRDKRLRHKVPRSFYSSVMVLPLMSNKINLGSLVFLSSKYSAFGEDKKMMAKDIAYKTAIILNIHRQMELLNIYNKKLQFEETVRMFQKNMSHDIKSPLRGIKTSLQLIKPRYVQDSFLYPFLEHMEQAVENAIDQLKESISLALEEKALFDSSYLVEELDDLRKLSEIENIKFVQINNFYEGIFAPKKAVRNILRSVVKNSIEALEFLDKENREIVIKYFADKEDMLNITVRDNGKGISSDAKDKVFGIYTEKKENGSGYGLMLAQYIIEKLGGSIAIESVENEYTIVTIKLKVN